MMRSFSESKTIALAIGAESGNVLNGTRLSPVVGDGFISIWATADVDSVDMELLVQSDNVCKKFEISDANRYRSFTSCQKRSAASVISPREKTWVCCGM